MRNIWSKIGVAIMLLIGLANAGQSASIKVSAMTVGTEYRYAFKGGTFPYVLRLCEGKIGDHFYRNLGLRGPWYENSEFVNAWAQNGFMDIIINGKPVLGGADENKKYPRLFDRCETLESGGDRGLVQYIWEREEAVVRLRFLVRSDARPLFAEIVIEPKQEIKSFKVGGSCYPGAYTTKGDGDRRMKTALRDEKSVAKVEADPQKENWMLFCDEKLDMAQPINRRVGFNNNGCAGLYVWPEGTEKVNVNLEGYTVGFGVAAKPGVLRMCLAFDELKMANAEAFKTMEKEALNVQKIFAEETFKPTSLSSFNAGQEIKLIDELAGKGAGRKSAGELRVMVAKIQEAIGAGGDKQISGEQRALAALEDYKRAFYSVTRHVDKKIKVFEMRGPGYSKYRVAGAAELAGSNNVEVTGGYLQTSNQGSTLTPFPNTVEDMYQYDLFMMLDVDTRALATQNLQMLRQYVEDGGALLVFGGFYSYGASNIKDTPLAEILPFAVDKFPLGLKKTPESIALQIAKKASFLNGISWENNLVSPWYHELTVKPDAEVIILNGDVPWLATRPVGKGRVMACAGNLFGEAPQGKVMYYEWATWKNVMGNMMRWLSGKEREIKGCGGCSAVKR